MIRAAMDSQAVPHALGCQRWGEVSVDASDGPGMTQVVELQTWRLSLQPFASVTRTALGLQAVVFGWLINAPHAVVGWFHLIAHGQGQSCSPLRLLVLELDGQHVGDSLGLWLKAEHL